MPRTLCLHMPYLPIDRLRRSCGMPSAEPVVIVAPSTGGLRVVHADAQALQRGVRQGQALAEACALIPGLRVHRQDESADREALKALAAWADCLSPIVHLEDAQTLLLDVTGSERLFRGESNLVRRSVEGVGARGFTVAAAIADTPGAAWALAHAGERQMMVSSRGHAAADLARLPAWSLRLDVKVSQQLRDVGIETVEALLHLPRASVASRFGEKTLLRLDQALGDAPEPLAAFHPPPVVWAQTRFTAATDRLDLLNEALDHALSRFCDELDRRMKGTRHVSVTFYFEQREPQVIALRISQPSRSRSHLRRLLHARIDGVKFADKIEAVILWTRRLEALDAPQQTWLDVGEQDDADLAAVLDRLSVRMGSPAVLRPHLVDDHQPELACEYAAATEERSESSRRAVRQNDGATQTQLRPLRLLNPPVAIRVMAVVPDGPPIRFEHAGLNHRVVAWTGPERVETGWWRGRGVYRDYYCVENEQGARHWLFRQRASGQWFLHGFFE